MGFTLQKNRKPILELRSFLCRNPGGKGKGGDKSEERREGGSTGEKSTALKHEYAFAKT